MEKTANYGAAGGPLPQVFGTSLIDESLDKYPGRPTEESSPTLQNGDKKSETSEAANTQLLSIIPGKIKQKPRPWTKCIDCCAYCCLIVGACALVFLSFFGVLLTMDSDLAEVDHQQRKDVGIGCFIAVGIYAILIILCRIRIKTIENRKAAAATNKNQPPRP